MDGIELLDPPMPDMQQRTERSTPLQANSGAGWITGADLGSPPWKTNKTRNWSLTGTPDMQPGVTVWPFGTFWVVLVISADCSLCLPIAL